VAFELLTGRRPFTADHPAAQARAHVEDSVPSASVVGTGLPPAVDRVLAAGMAKDPARRPATATRFMDDLEDAIDGAIAPAGPPTAVTAPITPRPPTTHSGRVVSAPAPKRRWPGLAALAALALVAGAAIAIAAGTGGNGDGGGATTAARATTHATSTSKAKPKTQATQTQATQTQATTQAPAQTQTTQPPQTAAPAPSAKSDDPVALNDQGFALIGQGKPVDAVAPLQRSVEAFRAQNRKGDIAYAYALYNLGNALRLSGRPAEAIPFLQERLQISNYKRGVVKKELKTAQQQAG
jgi:eukaryotic-like serine/threonine-protein kinase